MSGLLALVLAFSDPGAFFAPAELGGGGGNHFTGSPRSHFDCTVCHDRAPELKLTVESNPAGLFDKGYTPGQSYTLTFSVSDKGKVAGFGAELDVRDGGVAGTFTPLPADGDFVCLDGPNDTPGTDPVELFPAGPDDVPLTVVTALACKNSPSRWRATWTAPPDDVGLVNLFASAVAGNLDGSNRGDRAASLVLGVPSPSTVGQKAKGCGAAPGALLPVGALLLLLLRRRRGAAGLLLLALAVPATGWSAPKKKKHAHHPPVTRPAPLQPAPPVEPKPAPEPEPEPPKTAAPEPAPTPPEVAPAPAPVAPPAPAVVVEEDFPPAVHVALELGYGYRDLRLSSASFATPLRAQLGYPLVGVVMGFEPMRLLRTHVLEGLQLEGAYRRGWVLSSVPLGGAQVIPADGWVALGYQLELGRLRLAPRALYRVQTGGVEKNFSFDDALDQSVGGELRLAFSVGRLSVLLAPRAAAVLDSGTLATEGYGPQRGGLSLGGAAAVELELGAGFTLGAQYAFDRVTSSWAGGGKRALAEVQRTDVLQSGALTLRLAR